AEAEGREEGLDQADEPVGGGVDPAGDWQHPVRGIAGYPGQPVAQGQAGGGQREGAQTSNEDAVGPPAARQRTAAREPPRGGGGPTPAPPPLAVAGQQGERRGGLDGAEWPAVRADHDKGR